MYYLKYSLLFLLFLVISCDLPSESKIYHWAEHWIAVMDADGQNVQYLHQASDYHTSSECLKGFYRDGALKILETNYNTIKVMDANGENAITLKNTSAGISRCSVSSDGNYIVYSVSGNILKQATDGSQLVNLTEDTSYYDTDPQFSPISQEVVFVRRGTKNHYAAIMLLDENADQLTKLIDNTSGPVKNNQFSVPTFNRNATWIYYLVPGSKSLSGLYRINRDGSNNELIYQVNPSASPIVVLSNGNIAIAPYGKLFVFDSTGEILADFSDRLNDDMDTPLCFNFSPDGSLTALTTSPPYNSHIKLINIKTKEIKDLGLGWAPSFLPDGRILFIAKRWFESKNQKDVNSDWIRW